MTNEVRIVDPVTGGMKGSKDERYDLLPYDALDEIARVYGVGAKKYEDHNWLKGYAWGLSLAACFRHLSRFAQGEDRDPETGCLHVAHAAWHCLTLLTFYMRKLGTDNRRGPRPEPTRVYTISFDGKVFPFGELTDVTYTKTPIEADPDEPIPFALITKPPLKIGDRVREAHPGEPVETADKGTVTTCVEGGEYVRVHFDGQSRDELCQVAFLERLPPKSTPCVNDLKTRQALPKYELPTEEPCPPTKPSSRQSGAV